MTKIQFEVLRMFYEENALDTEMYARSLYKSEEIINRAIQILTEDGYLDATGITD